MKLNNTISNPDATTDLIIFMGVSGCGKTTAAVVLAKHYNFTYLDADNFHSAEARQSMANHIPLTDEQRAPWVAAIKQHLEDCAANNTSVCLAFSGLKQKHRNELRRAGLRTIFLFLNGDMQLIQARINSRQGHFMSPHLLASQFGSLEDPTHEVDVHTIDISHTFENVIADMITVVDKQLLRQ